MLYSFGKGLPSHYYEHLYQQIVLYFYKKETVVKINIAFNKKENNLHVVTETDLRMRQIQDVLLSKLIKQGIERKRLI